MLRSVKIVWRRSFSTALRLFSVTFENLCKQYTRSKNLLYMPGFCLEVTWTGMGKQCKTFVQSRIAAKYMVNVNKYSCPVYGFNMCYNGGSQEGFSAMLYCSV